MAQYQTVIYDRNSGTILKISPNRYISNKRSLAAELQTNDWKGLAFIYFPHAMPLDPTKHKVKRLTPNMPATIVSPDGLPLDFAAILYDRRAALSQGQTCLVEFEGGAGDQLMEAAAVMTAMATYKQSTFAIRAHEKYLSILSHIPRLCPVASTYVGHHKDAFTHTISNHTHYISDPRGGRYGKASLYGAWLGLQTVTDLVKIKLTSADFKQESQFFSTLPLKDHRYNFICQFRSGSGHGKSWQHQKVQALANLLHQHYDSNFFLVGSPREIPPNPPNIIDLTGKTTWWQTCLLISKMDLAICIDSGVMHLARSLSIPHITLWGGTNAQVILGEDEAPHDIRLDLPCRDLICYDCQNKTNACMQKITPEMVLKHARLLLHHPH